MLLSPDIGDRLQWTVLDGLGNRIASWFHYRALETSIRADHGTPGEVSFAAFNKFLNYRVASTGVFECWMTNTLDLHPNGFEGGNEGGESAATGQTLC
jgi:hypothetical protein